MAFPHAVWGSENESLKTSAAKRLPLGTQMVAEDGRCYRYCENGAAAQIVGHLMQSMVPLDDLKGEAIATIAAGVTVLTDIGGTTGNTAADVLVDGYFYSQTPADLNPAYRIKSNTLITQGAATGTITLYEPTEAAIAAATVYSAVQNPWKLVIIHGSPATAMLVGVPVKAVAGSQFGWLATRGPCRVLTEGTLIIGKACVQSIATTDGAVAPETVTGTNEIRVGMVLSVEASTDYSLVFLQLD